MFPEDHDKKELAIKRTKILLHLCSRYGRKCWFCGDPFTSFKEVEIDHIIPRSRGGSNNISNLAIACKLCNRAKLDLSVNEFLHWLRKSHAPVEYISERAKHPEELWARYANEINSGLRRVPDHTKKPRPFRLQSYTKMKKLQSI